MTETLESKIVTDHVSALKTILMKKVFLVLIVLIPSVLAAQNIDEHTEAINKLKIEEGYFGYDLFYPDSAGHISLGMSIKPGEADSSQLLHSFYSMDQKYLNINLEAGISYELTLGYDQFRKKYVLAAFDNAPGLVDIYQGNFDSEGNLMLDNLESGTHFLDADGTKNHNRLTFKNLSPHSYTLLVEVSTDEGETWQIQAVYEAFKE